MSDALALATALREAIAQERAETVVAVLAERVAWARFVKATDSVRIAANLSDQALFAKAMTEHAGAMQALRDLGVDVDALMEAK